MKLSVDQALSLTETYGTHECRKYRERIFSAHQFLSLALARQYQRTNREKGYIEANRELGRLHKRLTLGTEFQGIFIDSPDEDVKRFAEQKSLAIHGVFQTYNTNIGSRRAIQEVIEYLEACDLTFPLKNPDEASKLEIAQALLRCFDPDWWRRRIRKRQDLLLEHVMIELGLVNKQKGIYASNHCVERKLKQWQRNEDLLASLEAENDLGQVFNLLDLAKRGVSNLVNRRNELMTRLSGFESVAKDRGDSGVFYTLTAPSKYHSQLAKNCRPNPKYSGASPRDTQEYFNQVWARIRAKLKRIGIQPYGFRVVEPHHDGTPHWHMLLFVAPKDVETLNSTIRHYALEEDGTERGAAHSRVKVEYIDPNKGSAVGYIAKYIAKNIDGEHVGTDHYGKDAIESATRIRAWASNWSIRQFQSIGGPSVTVWREARQFANSELADKILDRIDDEKLKALVDAADTGNWKSFVELSGGPTAQRKDQPLRALHVTKDEPNKYGEAVNKLLGLIYRGKEKIQTKIREWTVRSIDSSKKTSNIDDGFSIGGANAPPLEFCQ